MKTVVEQCVANDESIILGGDFNEVIEDPNGGIARLARQCGLTDIIYQLHGAQPRFRTYDRGSTVIDYLFVSEDVIPAVKEAGVVGVLDEYRGEKVIAFVVLKEGETATEQDIINHCKTCLASYKVPAKVIFRSTLPMTAVGKVLRRELVKIISQDGN